MFGVVFNEKPDNLSLSFSDRCICYNESKLNVSCTIFYSICIHFSLLVSCSLLVPLTISSIPCSTHRRHPLRLLHQPVLIYFTKHSYLPLHLFLPIASASFLLTPTLFPPPLHNSSSPLHPSHRPLYNISFHLCYTFPLTSTVFPPTSSTSMHTTTTLSPPTYQPTTFTHYLPTHDPLSLSLSRLRYGD